MTLKTLRYIHPCKIHNFDKINEVVRLTAFLELQFYSRGWIYDSSQSNFDAHPYSFLLKGLKYHEESQGGKSGSWWTLVVPLFPLEESYTKISTFNTKVIVTERRTYHHVPLCTVCDCYLSKSRKKQNSTHAKKKPEESTCLIKNRKICHWIKITNDTERHVMVCAPLCNSHLIQTRLRWLMYFNSLHISKCICSNLCNNSW